MKRKQNIFFIILLLCCILSTCRCNRPQLVIKKILIEVPHELPAWSTKESQEELKEAIRDTIIKNPNFHFNAGNDKGGLLRIGFLSDAKEGGLVQCVLSYNTNGEDSELKSFASLDVSKGLEIVQLKAGLEYALQDLSQLALLGVIDQENMHKILEKALDKKRVPSAVLVNAIGSLATKKDPEDIPLLARLLFAADDLGVVNACISGLSEYSSDQSMEAIIDFAERKQPYIRRQAVMAARKIANPLAMQWLLVMAYGHEDAVVRKEAEEALFEVEAKLNRN